jgi:hypothetical protein
MAIYRSLFLDHLRAKLHQTFFPAASKFGRRQAESEIAMATGHKKCEWAQDGKHCTTQPSFNMPGKVGGKFCAVSFLFAQLIALAFLKTRSSISNALLRYTVYPVWSTS